ncbi:MAG: GNAT family N-acetyltransferase, partial [Burkholderiales bacterium]|nr:GNAT family N-acetyltransferase [Burkholderiales bacterium]
GGQLLGCVQATVFVPGSAWIAYVFSSRHWGRGHAHEATAAMLAHLAQDCGVDRFLATVEVENERSIRLLDRLGFERAGAHEMVGHDLSATELLFLR